MIQDLRKSLARFLADPGDFTNIRIRVPGLVEDRDMLVEFFYPLIEYAEEAIREINKALKVDKGPKDCEPLMRALEVHIPYQVGLKIAKTKDWYAIYAWMLQGEWEPGNKEEDELSWTRMEEDEIKAVMELKKWERQQQNPG